MANFETEIKVNEEYDMVDEPIVADDGNGIGTGVAMLIGAGLAFAAGGAVKLGKWAWGKIKANKEAKQSDKETPAENVDAEKAEAAE